MANIQNVRIGDVDVFLNEIHLGHTKGGVDFKFERSFEDLTVDKYGETPVDMALTGQNLTVEANLAEITNDVFNVAVPEGAYATVLSMTNLVLVLIAVTSCDRTPSHCACIHATKPQPITAKTFTSGWLYRLNLLNLVSRSTNSEWSKSHSVRLLTNHSQTVNVLVGLGRKRFHNRSQPAKQRSETTSFCLCFCCIIKAWV
jgi:hypothetical protein